MIKNLLLAWLTVAICGSLFAEYVKGDLLFRNNFTSRDSLAGWSLDASRVFDTNGGINGKGAVHLQNNQLISYELDPKNFTGIVIFEAIYKGAGIKEPEKPYWGAKVQLKIERANKNIIWSEPVHSIAGTFGWKLVQKIEQIPEDTQKLTIILGLENTTGDYWCDSFSIYRGKKIDIAVKKTETPPSRTGDWKGGNYRGFMSGNDLSDAAFRTLADWNANLLRYQMTSPVRRDISSKEKYLDWINDEMKKMDQVLELCQKYGIKMVIDLHTGPAGSRRNAVASNVITDPALVLSQLQDAWQLLATHYKGNPCIYGYDILNEPQTEDFVQKEKHPWNRISSEIVKVIRTIDNDMPIIIEPDLSAVRTLHYIDAPNIIYSVHAYAPIEYTHQHVTDDRMLEWSYPGEINGVKWDRAALRNDLQKIREFQLKHNVRIFVGEFSTIIWAKGREQYLADLIDVFEEFEWDWTYHAFREWPGWSLEYTADKPMTFDHKPDNPARKVVLEVLKKNKMLKIE